ncbi:MAG TPA: adenylosuccinate lyase, partial [Candidatus Paceibacterota bacterium]|nr:adenylosuccinate lyase [Candidatus Paceibacterota bacterium]
MSLRSISPIDGRYAKSAESLSSVFSECGLERYRVKMECEYLIALSKLNIGLRKLTPKEEATLRGFYENFSDKDSELISDIEWKGYKNIKATDHDVKAVEYFLKLKCADTTLKDVTEWIHFALTSEDTNNISYALMLREGSNVLLSKLKEVVSVIENFAKEYKKLPMLARTHGQPASPTTFGKEFKVFAERLKRQIKQLENHTILCKLNGATGNYNAHTAAFPKVDWRKFSKNFIAGLSNLEKSGLSLEANLYTTQIEPHDSYIELFDCIRRINTILIGFNQDMWRYISDEWITQRPVEGAVGSSTMPHKVNPIKFENSEGNLGLANALFEFFARKLPISRLQRDLTDSTVQRNFGGAFAHSLIAYNYLLNGLSRISVNENKVKEALLNHPEVVTEAVQTVLRTLGVPVPYEKLKELSRGKKLTLADIHTFIDG